MEISEELSGTGSCATRVPASDEVERFARRLAGEVGGLDDAARIDLIRELEVLKCAAEGAQAALTADFATSVRAQATEAGEPPERQGRGIAAQVALARRVSHHRGRTLVGLATVLATEMPHTRNALRSGLITERKAVLLAQETACVSLEDRQTVDRRVVADREQLDGVGDRELADRARSVVAELDPASLAERRRRAEADRHTTLRPAPDVMAWFTALLPVKDGVAVHKALRDEADRRRAAGDTRSRGAIMADTLVARVTRPHLADLDGAPAVPLVIHVVVPDTVLLGDDDGTGWVEDYGDVPGDLLREWIAAHAESGVQDWVKRLYRSPRTGELVTMDKSGRRFEGALAEFLRLRDRRCRTPYCDAPVRHLDHVDRAADAGPTSAANAQGLCEACNYAKEARGWSARPRPGPFHTVEVRTPTGHRYLSYDSVRDPRAAARGVAMEIYPLEVRVA